MKQSILKLVIVAGIGASCSFLTGCSTESTYQGTQRVYPSQWEWGQGSQMNYTYPAQMEWGARTQPAA